jgi:hypothetical protein
MAHKLYNTHKCNMMRRILYVSAIASIYIVLLISIMDNRIIAEINTTQATTSPFRTVKIPILRFKISYPSDWGVTVNGTIIYFRSPNNAARVILTVNDTSLNLEQYTSHQINMIKTDKTKNAGVIFKFLESSSYLLSGNPGHKIVFMNGTKTDTEHDYKDGIVWTIVDGKIYQIRYTVEFSKYSNYASMILEMINSFEIL